MQNIGVILLREISSYLYHRCIFDDFSRNEISKRLVKVRFVIFVNV